MEHPNQINARINRIEGGKALARLREFESERGLGETQISRSQPVSYLAVFSEKEKLETQAPAIEISQTWKPLGPFAVPHGQTYGEGPGSRPPVAGRVSAIAVDPSNDKHILIGAAGGGIWESKDSGTIWFPRTDYQKSLFIGAVCFDSSNPSIAYAGTGEGDSMWRLGVGVLRSADGGTTWKLFGSEQLEKIGFFEIVVDPLQNTHIIGATTSGLWESFNSGDTWQQNRREKTWSISVCKVAEKSEILIGSESGVFSSRDSGASWESVLIPDFRPTPVRIEVCHVHPNGEIAYVFVAGTPNKHGESPVPQLWRRESREGKFISLPVPGDLKTGSAWYDWCAAAPYADPNTLYLGAADIHKGLRSGAGDWAWFNLSSKGVGDSIHPDQHTIAFSPSDPNIFYAGCDGGIFRSRDGGLHFEPLNKGLSIAEIEYLAQHPRFESWILAGTQDNGTMRYEGGEVWYHAQDGDGGDCAINVESPYICYHTYFGIGIERSDTGGGWGSWNKIGPFVPDEKNFPAGSLFYPPLAVNGPVVVHAGVSVYVSTNSGMNWSEIPLPQGSSTALATAIAVPRHDLIYVSTDEGNIFRIEFSENQWPAPTILTQPAKGVITDLIVDPTNGKRLWVTYSNLPDGAKNSRVFRSDDRGKNWLDVGKTLPQMFVNAIQIDPLKPDTVYVALDVGVWRSTDAGENWISFNKGLPNALIKDLVFHARSRLLRAATQSRGVWEIAVDESTLPDVEVYIRNSSIDTGRFRPSASAVDDPFSFGQQSFWWQSPDIKIDAAPYQRALPGDIDFEVFQDDHGVSAAGLFDTSPRRNELALIYVQVHNRGTKPASEVTIKLFFADTSAAWPNLPDGFWKSFPDNISSSDSAWTAVADHKVLPMVEPGRSHIAVFEWPVPRWCSSRTSFLAVISAANDPINETELAIEKLVRKNAKCGLKQVIVVTEFG
jgi:photosystem II stability/assembly factor-like uncharacterized protein